MSEQPGQDPGQDHAAGYAWGDLVGTLVEEHGTLTAVAWKLIEHAAGDDVASIERALRRLRTRGQRDGGVWGQRVLRVFGVPASIETRLRWVGLYHSPFNDLPLPLCLDQLRLWDRPPVSESRARLWLQLGFATCALRERRFDDAAAHVAHVAAALAGLPAAYDVARLELALMEGYLASRRDAPPETIDAALDRAERLLATATLDADDTACFRARLVDQRAYQLNHAGDHAAAAALYASLPDADVHPFASYRRDSGRAYGEHKAGRSDAAIRLARRACEYAGDGGYVRMRAMGLLMVAKVAGGDEAVEARARAHAIAARLGDAELLARVMRAGA